jgi:hypothetical protein
MLGLKTQTLGPKSELLASGQMDTTAVAEPVVAPTMAGATKNAAASAETSRRRRRPIRQRPSLWTMGKDIAASYLLFGDCAMTLSKTFPVKAQ